MAMAQPMHDDDERDDRYRPGYELVAERLLAYIASEGLNPGDRLPTEKGLAEILDTTRNVTREALKVLAALGRVSVRKGAGIFVAAPTGFMAGEVLADFKPTDMEHVLMLLDYRRLIETETSRLAATLATPIEVRAIRDTAAQSVAASTTSPEAFAIADALFHDTVGMAAHNVFLQSTVSSIRRYANQSDTLLFHGDTPGSLEVAAAQHQSIAEAIASGDPDQASELMSNHIETTQHQFERKIRDRLFARQGDAPRNTP